MKKLVRFLVLIVATITFLGAFIGCGAECEHSYVDQIIKEPTIISDGLKNVVCEKCGEYTSQVLAKYGNSYGYDLLNGKWVDSVHKNESDPLYSYYKFSYDSWSFYKNVNGVITYEDGGTIEFSDTAVVCLDWGSSPIKKFSYVLIDGTFSNLISQDQMWVKVQ